MEVDPKDVQAGKAAAAEMAARKRAGLPELQLDALPSTIATKLMILSLLLFGGKVVIVKGFANERINCTRHSRNSSPTHNFSHPIRTCLVKRQNKLQDGLDKLSGAAKLSTLQEQTLVPKKVDIQKRDPVSTHCSLHPSQVFDRPSRMKAKIQQVIKDLQSISEDIDAKYATGVVHGFSEEPGSELIW